jgi:hypothetical protein
MAQQPRQTSNPQEHHLFIIVGGSADSQSGTIRILQFLAHCKPWLARIGVVMVVHKVKSEMLRDPRLVAALQSKGLSEFPSVKTPRKRFLGVKQIAQAYTMVIEDFKRMLKSQGEEDIRTDHASGRKGTNVPGGASDDDIYRNFYASELSFSAAETDHGDDGMGGGGKDAMMEQFRGMTERRQTIESARSKSSGAYIEEDASVQAQRRGGAGMGDDAADEQLIDRLIATTTAPVTQETLDRAFKGDGGSEDAQDDLMLHAFWENKKESI